MHSTADQPPFLGPQFPVYPALAQVVRVAAGAVLGTNVYAGFLQQWNGGLQLRDREQVYLWEPNGIFLQPGYYDGRLIGVYAGLPLLVTWCCPQVSPSFPSASSRSSGG